MNLTRADSEWRRWAEKHGGNLQRFDTYVAHGTPPWIAARWAVEDGKSCTVAVRAARALRCV